MSIDKSSSQSFLELVSSQLIINPIAEKSDLHIEVRCLEDLGLDLSYSDDTDSTEAHCGSDLDELIKTTVNELFEEKNLEDK